MNEISDTRLLHMWRKHISNLPQPDSEKLKGFLFCGSRATRLPYIKPGVFIINNGLEGDDNVSRIYGVNFCNSSWACPRCTPVVMSKTAARIAAALDALEKRENEIATMVTFTMPHVFETSCKDTFNMLLKSWSSFSKRRTGKTYTLKNGQQKLYKFNNASYRRVQELLEIKHTVKVFEFTWGIHGWHPHIHALWWIPKKNFNKLLEYEDGLREQWWAAVTYQMKKYLKEHPPQDQQAIDYYDKILNMTATDVIKNTQSVMFVISKNKNGTIRQQKSSYYACGWTGSVNHWSADSEMNQSLKRARKGHFSPTQLLEEAHNTTDPNKRQYFLKLYTEYAIATRGRRRTAFSLGLKKIIEDWLQSADYIETVKKKFTELATARPHWKIVCWFSEDDWSEICWLDRRSDTSIVAEILQRARLPNAKHEIDRFLEKYGIRSQDKPHHLQNHLETKVLNAAA